MSNPVGSFSTAAAATVAAALEAAVDGMAAAVVVAVVEMVVERLSGYGYACVRACVCRWRCVRVARLGLLWCVPRLLSGKDCRVGGDSE